MPGSQVPTSVTRLESMLGYQAVSLTIFDSSTLSSIAAGSKVEIAGAFFTFASDETINLSSWTAITTGNTAYIALTPAGAAGSQTVTASYTATAPVWSTSKQGWYASAGSSVRIIGSVYKLESFSQIEKLIFNGMDSQGGRKKRIYLTTGTFLVPANIREIYLTGCAAGGSGGNGFSGSNYASGGGGGGGEIVYKKRFSVTPATVYTVTIGGIGSNTSFGPIVFNFGADGGNGTSGAGGSGGGGGALGNGTVAGRAGGAGGFNGSGSVSGTNSVFADGGSAAISGGGGGGGGGIAVFAYYSDTATTQIKLQGGGSGGSAFITTTPGGPGSSGGYGCGGGGGGGSAGGAGGPGGAGGSAILIVEW
jgi:hypothetical protein